MARKHFDEYLKTITKQYMELQDTLKEMSVECEKGMIEPERLEQLKMTIAPVKNSFDTLVYIKYLLDMPTRKSKHTKYNHTNKKIIEDTKHVSKDKVIQKNSEVIASLSNCI